MKPCQQDITSLGINWQLNPAIRFVFQGHDVKVDRLNASGVQIGQAYTTFAARAQFNY
jgi:phosphate-selective porin OprO/OprP